MSFSILRKKLSQVPSKYHSFPEICDIFDNWKEDDIQLAIEYAKQHLESWDDTFRWATQKRLTGLLRDKEKHPVWWPLVREFSGRLPLPTYTTGQLPLHEVTHLGLSYPRQNNQALSAIFENLAKSCHQVKKLTLKGERNKDLDVSILHSWHALEHLTNLTLHGYDNIENLRSLAGFTKVRSLTIEYFLSIYDINDLEMMENLTQLRLANTPSMSYGSNKHPLSFGCNKDLDVLAKLPHLKVLELSDLGDLEDLRVLASLENLTRLHLCGHYFTDLSPLAGLTSLTHLTIEGCPHIDNIDFLKQLSNLRYLHIENCEEITSLEPLEQLTNLHYLTINYCDGIESFDILKKLPNLRFVYVEDSPILETLDRIRPENTTNNQSYAR